jgi:hypothetical protein
LRLPWSTSSGFIQGTILAKQDDANIRAAIVETDVYLVAAACLYLACKVEECPQHIRTIAQECLNCHANSMTSSNASVWQDGKSAGDVAKIAEVEFHLIDELETQLIIHHPYRVLSALNEKLCLPQKDFDIAWVLCNETYSTDVPLLYSPHAIAYTAVYLSISLNRARGGNIPPSTDGTSGKDPVIDKLTAFVASTTDQVPLSDVANCAQMFLTHLVILDNLKLDKAPPGSFSDSWRESMNARAILKRIKGEELARVRKQKLPENLLNLQRPSSRQQK